MLGEVQYQVALIAQVSIHEDKHFRKQTCCLAHERVEMNIWLGTGFCWCGGYVESENDPCHYLSGWSWS